jgi:hypothetical protein
MGSGDGFGDGFVVVVIREGIGDGIGVVGFGDGFGVIVFGEGNGFGVFDFSGDGYNVGKDDGCAADFADLLNSLASLDFDDLVSLDLGPFALLETAVLNIFFPCT